MKPTSYITINKQSETLLIEKKSRFIGHALPVTTEEEALSFINSMRSRYYDASHNVYAYVISENNIARFSDDGEPGGTAGMPVMEVLKKEGITDAVVVVTRYFGGTLLGAGGLVRAYSRSAKQALDGAEIAERVYCCGMSMSTGYENLGKLRYLIEKGGYILDDIKYEDNITISAYVRHDLADKFIREVTEATNGAVEVIRDKEMYV